jgi:hypothetical protein
VSHRIRVAAKAMVTRQDGPPMQQAIADARENRKVVILNDDVSAPCRIDKGAGRAPFSRTPIKQVPARGRAARLWVTAAFLSTTILTTAFFGATAGALDIERDQASRAGEKSVQLAQAMTDDPEERQKALDQEHRRAELLARELTTVRHLEMLLTLQKARVESAQLRQLPENEYAALVKSLQQERDQLKQAAESGVAELCKSLPGDPAERLVQDLAAARRDVETQTALATRASDEAAKLTQAAKGDTVELRKSLQQEQERAGRLEQDLAAARRDVETQTALATKGTDNASQAKQAADTSAAELRKSLQQEQERAGRLEQDLAVARRDVETQTALAAKATDDAGQAKQAADSSATELRKSLQQERERAGRLEQDLAAARRDVETQTALAAKATDDAGQAKQAADSGATELRKSLQQERERAGRLEQDLDAARRDVETQAALATKASDDASQLKQVAKDSAELKRSLQKEHERADALAKDLSMGRAAIYAYEAQARKAIDQAAAPQQAAENGAAALRKSLQQEQERAARLQQDLVAARRDVETQTALAAKTGTEAARLKQAAEDSSAESQRSLQQERDKTARLEWELASERKTKDFPAASGVVTAGRLTQDKQPGADAIRPVAANQTTAAAARSDARPDPVNAAEVARLAARASMLLGQGDIASARIVLERAAETGNAQASFALAETYDPLVLRKWGAYGTLGDAAKARDLYARAQAGGVKEARERFDALHP